MKFYSYDYLISRIQIFDWLKAIITAIILIGLIFAVIQYNRNKNETKYRELIIIALIAILLIAGTTISDYRSSAIVVDQQKAAIKFIENASKQLDADASHIYINTEAAVDGAIIKVDDKFYRIIKGSDQDKYLLEKLELYKPEIELVEVK